MYELFRVEHISKPSSTKNPYLSRKFLRQDLMKINREELIKELGENQYVVEKIISKKGSGKNTLYEVKWFGYPSSSNTFEKPQSSYQKSMMNMKTPRRIPKIRPGDKKITIMSNKFYQFFRRR